MVIYTNFTRHAVGEIVGLDPEGAEFYAVIVKETFTWNENGQAAPAAEPSPLLEQDLYAGEPGLSGPLMESDYAPQKSRVDVLVAGAIILPAPAATIDCSLEVG